MKYVEIDGKFSFKWIYYGPQEIYWTIGEYSYFGLFSSSIISKDIGLQGLTNGYE